MPVMHKHIKFFLKKDIQTIEDLDGLSDEVNACMHDELYAESADYHIQAFVTSQGGEKTNIILLVDWTCDWCKKE